jgi:undecaprenyl phosphate N,N'-diacetylbacillosamine 1-phosphate transferase
MYAGTVKPLFDFIFALVLTIVFSPLYLLVGLLILLSMGRPLLFVQTRPGRDEKPFTIYKFRTMTNETDETGALLGDEQRLKGVGKLIRSLSLDELPQLFNVLKGEMSFVGPRPLLVEYLPLYNDEQKRRHEVKPGITGWAQVNGRNAISWKEKFEFDVYYVDHISFLLDCKIIWMTLKKVFAREGISAQDHITTEKFNGTK